MINFPGKKIAVKIFNKVNLEISKAKAKKLYPHFEKYIRELYFKNYGVALPLPLLSFLDELCRIIKPEFIFEFGSGVSTVVLAKSTQDRNCKIFTVDESLKYLEKTYQNIIRKYKADNITFIFLPNNYSGFIENIEAIKKVDLLLVDGPSSAARFNEPSKNFYDKIISSQTVCIIDDTDREDNNRAAENIAKAKALKKADFRDIFYSKKHRSSILYPSSIEDKVMEIRNWQELKVN